MLTTSLEPGASRGGTTLTVKFSVPVSRVLLATVEGGLNLATAPELDTRVRAELRRRGPHWLVMDLSGLQFLGLQGTAVFERQRRGAAAGVSSARGENACRPHP
jgi:hypothetical protein